MNSPGRGDGSQASTAALMNMVRREIEHLETRLTSQIIRVREGSEMSQHKADKIQEVTFSRFEQKMKECELAQSKMDKKISEMSGAIRGLSDEAQSHIRRADMVDSRLYDMRHQMEEEFRQKLGELGSQMQEMGSIVRGNISSCDDAIRMLAPQVKRLDGEMQDLRGLNTLQAMSDLQERLDAIEVAYQREAENTKATCGEIMAGRRAGMQAINVSAGKDPIFWTFERQLGDLSQKVESLFLEAHGDRGWDALFQEHEVRLAGIRSKLDSLDAHSLSADDHFRVDIEQKIEQLRKSNQEMTHRHIENNEQLDALLRSRQVVDSALDELRAWVTDTVRNQSNAIVQSSASQVQVPATAAAESQKRMDALTDSVQSMAKHLQSSVLETQQRLVALETEVRTSQDRRVSEALSMGQEAQVLDDKYAARLKEVCKDFSSVVEHVRHHDQQVLEIKSKLGAFEKMAAGVRPADTESENDIRSQVADLARRIPEAEHLSKQTVLLVDLAAKLTDVQKDTAKQLQAYEERESSDLDPRILTPRNYTDLTTRVVAAETTVYSMQTQLAEITGGLEDVRHYLDLRGGNSGGGVVARTLDSDLAQASAVATTTTLATIGSSMVANEIGSLFQRVEEGEHECTKLQDQLKGRIATMDALLDKVAKEVLGPEGADVASAVALAVGAVDTISSKLPKGLRLCILGGTSWIDSNNRQLVEAIAQQASVHLAGRIVVITSGLAGVQEAFVKGLNAEVPVVNLASPEGSGYKIGQDVASGSCIGDRMVLLGQLGDVYLTVEGGPDEAKEAKAAFARGAAVLPLICSGGASAGMYDFPSAALRRPAFATEAQWASLSQKGMPELTANSIVEMLEAAITMIAPSESALR